MNKDTEKKSEPEYIFFDSNIDSAFKKSKNWIKFLLGKWILITIFCICGLILGIVYAKSQQVEYESYLTFSLDENSSSSGGFAGLAAQFGLGAADNGLFSGDNIIEVIKSRIIIERALLSTDSLNGKPITLINYYNQVYFKSTPPDTKSATKPIEFPVGLNKQQFTYAQDSVLYKTFGDIVKNFLIAARPDKQLNVYVIKFKSPDERFTKVFTDKILAETIQFYTELKTKKSETTLKILEQRIDFIKGNLNAAITDKANVQDANVNPAFSAAQVPVQKQQLNMQVYGTAYGELYKNLELARFQYLQNIPLLQVINNNDYPMQRNKPGWIKTGLTGAFLFALLATFLLTVFYIIKRKK